MTKEIPSVLLLLCVAMSDSLGPCGSCLISDEAGTHTDVDTAGIDLSASTDGRPTGFILSDEPRVETEYNLQDVAKNAEHTPGFDLSCMGEVEVQELQLTKGFIFGESMDDELVDCEEIKSSWNPGLDVGSWVRRRWAPLNAQCQVLLANVVLNLKKLPPAVLRSMLDYLPSFPECSVSSLHFRAASWLVRLPQGTLRNMYQKLQNGDWQPKDVQVKHESLQVASDDSVAAEAPDSASYNIMRLLVREALGPLDISARL